MNASVSQLLQITWRRGPVEQEVYFKNYFRLTRKIRKAVLSNKQTLRILWGINKKLKVWTDLVSRLRFVCVYFQRSKAMSVSSR